MRIATYARFSTDNQRDASIDDQLRNVRSECSRRGWPMPEVYQDAAISGSRDDRPGYQAMLAAASSGRFDVLVIDDLNRLNRDSAEQITLIRRFTFHGIRIVGVSDGTDTSRDGHELDTGIRAVIGEHALKTISKNTHRGLTGRALAGSSAGGLPYGYKVTTTGQRAIDPEQAAVVRRIFELFVAGNSPRAIAATLNAERAPTARGAPWAMSAIYGDVKRGIGILANPIYIGRQIWNRSRWVKHPTKKRRIRVERPESEWIVTEHPELAIVEQALWDRAQSRLGKSKGAKGTSERATTRKFMLSGLLRCDCCGGKLVVVDYYRYGCAVAKDRGPAACASTLKVARSLLERSILATVKRDFLTEEAFKVFETEARRLLKIAAPDIEDARRALRDAERTRENILVALRAGIITASTKTELERAEAAVEAARSDLEERQQFQPSQILPRARATFRRMVATLENLGSVAEVRQAIRELLGDQIVVTKKAGILYAEVPAFGSEISLVAGARYGRRLTQPLRIPITRGAAC